MKILAPIDGSNNASRVIDYLKSLATDVKDLEIVLLNVREPVDADEVRQFLSEARIREFQEKEGRLLTDAASAKLTAAGIRNTSMVSIGEIAPTIVEQCKAQTCDQIVMGSRGLSSIASLLMGSVATKVIHLAEVPVTFVK